MARGDMPSDRRLPDRAQARASIAAEKAQRLKEWKGYITRSLLPVIRDTLNARDLTIEEVGSFRVLGSRTGVAVKGGNEDLLWIPALLDVLKRHSSGYTIDLVGVRHPVIRGSLPPPRQQLELDYDNPIESVKNYLKRYPDGQVRVRIK